MQYGGRMPPQPGQGMGGQGMGPGPSGPMPSGMGGGQGGGGPQPMPPQGGGMQGNNALSLMGMDPTYQRGMQRDRFQGGVDDAARAFQQATIQGSDPMTIARLQEEWMNAQRGYGDWQQQQYAQGMGDMSRRGPGSVGGGPGQSQLEQNPYLAMLLQSQLGMGGGGGGGGGSPMGGLGPMGRG